MELRKIDKQGYKLHLIKNNNFKTILVKVIFWEKLIEEELTIRNMLLDNLLFSSKKYDTSKKMNIKKQDLYDVNFNGINYRRGKYIFTDINFSVIEDKFSEKGLLKSSLEFLFDTLLNPNVVNGKFNEESYNITFERLRSSIISIKESPEYYSFLEYKKLLGKDKTFSVVSEGNLDDLNKINPRNLYDYYKKFFQKNNIDILVVGNFDFDEIEQVIEDNFKINKDSFDCDDFYCSYEKDFSEHKIASDFNQSKLIMGGSLNKLSLYEKKYALLAYNIIFGNSPSSLIFKNIREKHSYAYSISSGINKFDDMFYIRAGISKDNYEDVKREVLKEMENMKKGKFTNKAIKSAKEGMLGVLKEIDDYQSYICSHYFIKEYFGNDSISEQKENIKNITKESIMNVAKKINIDTILLVEEKDNGKN